MYVWYVTCMGRIEIENSLILSAQDMEKYEKSGPGNGVQKLLDDVVTKQDMLTDRRRLEGGGGWLLAGSMLILFDGPQAVEHLVRWGADVLSGEFLEGTALTMREARGYVITYTSALLQLYNHYTADPDKLLGPAIQQAIEDIPKEAPKKYPRLTEEGALLARRRFSQLTAPPAPKP